MTLLHCGIYGTLTFPVLVLLRKCLHRRTPAWIWPCLWILLGLRFLLPFGVTPGLPVPAPLRHTEAALQTFLTAEITVETVSEATVPAGITETAEEETLTPEEQAAFDAWLEESNILLGEMEEQREQTEKMVFWRGLLSRLWLAGSVICGTYFFLLYLLLQRHIRQAEPCDPPFPLPSLRRKIRYQCSSTADTPMTCGILRPVILLPAGIMEEALEVRRVMVIHEFCHIRRFDVLTKAFLLLVAAVHWWNPFVWLLLRLANRDMEMACDEAAVRMLDGDGRRYAEVLLHAAERRAEKRKNHRLVLPFGESPLTERIMAVLDGRKKYLWLAVLLLCVISAALVCCAPAQVEEPAEVTDIAVLQAKEEAMMAAYSDARAEEERLNAELEKYLAALEAEKEELLHSARLQEDMLITLEKGYEDTTRQIEGLEEQLNDIMAQENALLADMEAHAAAIALLTAEKEMVAGKIARLEKDGLTEIEKDEADTLRQHMTLLTEQIREKEAAQTAVLVLQEENNTYQYTLLAKQTVLQEQLEQIRKKMDLAREQLEQIHAKME